MAAKLIFQGREQNTVTVLKGTTVEIPVDIISDVGEYIAAESMTMDIYANDNRSETPVESVGVTANLLVLSEDVSGAGLNALDYNTSYYVYGSCATSGGDEYTGIYPSTITVK